MLQKDLKSQISALQKKLALVQAYESLASNLQKEEKAELLLPDRKDLRSEIVKNLVDFCQLRISEILEEPKNQPRMQPPDVTPLTAESNDIAPKAKANITINPADSVRDPLKFITKYKHWCNHPIKFTDGVGNEIEGQVTGLAFPHLLVTANDNEINVDPLMAQLIISKGN